MIRIKKISKGEVPELIRLSYEGDNDLLEKYHVGKYTLGQAVIVSCQMMEFKSKKEKLSYYKVIFRDKPVGYFITYEKHLFSFGIAMNFRTKEILTSWFDSVKKVLGDMFTTELYDNNTRAIKFLQKQGMKVALHNEKSRIVTLQYI